MQRKGFGGWCTWPGQFRQGVLRIEHGRQSMRHAAASVLNPPNASMHPDHAYPLNVMVLMLNPNVGLMVVMSSPLSRFTSVVFPALSRPLQEQIPSPAAALAQFKPALCMDKASTWKQGGPLTP